MQICLPYKKSQICFTDIGDGHAVVLLHGYLESREIWNEYAEDLSKNNRVICIDLPGHGKTGIFGDVHSMEFMAEVVKTVIDFSEIPHCCLIGHSMGGYVALAFAEKYPELLEGLCLFHSHPNSDNEEKKENRSREIDLIRLGKKEMIFRLSIPNLYATRNQDKMKEKIDFSMNIAMNMSDEGIIAAMEGMKCRPDRNSVLKNAAIPVMMLIGENDNLIPAAMLKDIARANPRIQCVLLEESGHMGFFEEPVKALTAIKKFLTFIGNLK